MAANISSLNNFIVDGIAGTRETTKSHSETILWGETYQTAAPDRGSSTLNDTKDGANQLCIRHAKTVINICWTDGHATLQNVPRGINPYSVNPFRNGLTLKNQDNHFDRY